MAITNHIEKVQNSLPLGRVSEVINVLYTNGFMSMNPFHVSECGVDSHFDGIVVNVNNGKNVGFCQAEFVVIERTSFRAGSVF